MANRETQPGVVLNGYEALKARLSKLFGGTGSHEQDTDG